jgi:hypothetical protein
MVNEKLDSKTRGSSFYHFTFKNPFEVVGFMNYCKNQGKKLEYREYIFSSLFIIHHLSFTFNIYINILGENNVSNCRNFRA